MIKYGVIALLVLVAGYAVVSSDCEADDRPEIKVKVTAVSIPHRSTTLYGIDENGKEVSIYCGQGNANLGRIEFGKYTTFRLSRSEEGVISCY